MKIASAFPKHSYSQKILPEKLLEYWGDQLRHSAMLARLHRNAAVEGGTLGILAAMGPEFCSELVLLQW